MQGGFYERLIGIMKSVSQKIVGSVKCFDELNTVLLKIENMFSTRLLTFLPKTFKDITTSLHNQLIVAVDTINKVVNIDRTFAQTRVKDVSISVYHYLNRFNKVFIAITRESG